MNKPKDLFEIKPEQIDITGLSADELAQTFDQVIPQELKDFWEKIKKGGERNEIN